MVNSKKNPIENLDQMIQEFLKTIGKTLSDQRKKRGLNTKEVEIKVDISEGTLERIENGLINSTLSTFVRLCKYYGVHPKDMTEQR